MSTFSRPGAGGGGGGPPALHGVTHKGDGTDPVPIATTTVSGLLSGPDKLKLDGLGAGGGSYVHTQAVAAAIWNVAHNLGMYPNVTVKDTLGDTIIGEVDYTDANNLIITFSTAVMGTAYVS